MLIQTKPKEAGMSIEAVQFLGDPKVHPNIVWRNEEPIRPGYASSGHWRLTNSTLSGGSSYLEIGDWIYHDGRCLKVITRSIFERDWQIVK